VKEVSGEEFLVIEADRRAGDPAAVIAVANKIKQVLGWVPQYNDLQTIVRSAYGWEKKSKALTTIPLPVSVALGQQVLARSSR
jgi:UDP-glucose 4-epimerase